MVQMIPTGGGDWTGEQEGDGIGGESLPPETTVLLSKNRGAGGGKAVLTLMP